MTELLNREEHERKLGDCLKNSLGSREREFAKQLGDPPDVGNIDPSLWGDIRFELDRCLEEILLAAFLASATQHLVDNILIQVSYEQARKRMQAEAEAWAGRRARELSQQLVNNSRNILKRKRDYWQRRIERGEEVGREQGSGAAREIFGRERRRRIRITSITDVIATGGETAMQQAGLTHPNDLWINHPELSRTGPCPVCLPLHRTIRVIWSVKFPMGPPAHGYCVCEIIYWNSKQRIEATGPDNLDLSSVFIGTPSGDVIAPLDRGTRPSQMGIR